MPEEKQQLVKGKNADKYKESIFDYMAGFQCHAIQNISKLKSKPLNR